MGRGGVKTRGARAASIHRGGDAREGPGWLPEPVETVVAASHAEIYADFAHPSSRMRALVGSKGLSSVTTASHSLS